MSSERGRLFASLHETRNADKTEQPHFITADYFAGAWLVGSFSAQECSSPKSWLSPPRTPQATYLWLWPGLRHPRKAGDYHRCSRPCGGSQGRLPDMSGSIRTFVVCLNSKAQAEKRSEVETGLESFRRR